MFWKAICFIYLVKTTYTGTMDSRKVVLLENKCWGEGQDQVKTDQGYLSEVEASIGDGEFQMFIYKCYLSEGFWCKVDGHRYNVIKEKKADEIKKYMDSSKNENHYLRLWFTFTDIPIINEQGFQCAIKERKYYMTYNVIKKSNENFTENVKNDGIDIRLISIRESFLFYITNRFLKINEIIDEINRKRSKENLGCFIHKANFKLYYFKDFGTCFENVKKFSLNIRRLRLVKDEDFETLTVETSGSSLDKDCTLKTSHFLERLRSKFDQLQGYKLDLSGPSRCISTETLEILFKKACNHLKEKIMSKNILIPIGKDFGIEYYLEELFKIIYRVITSIYKTYDTIPPEEENAIFKFLFKSLDELYGNLETASVKNVFESEYVHKYFAELLGREVKDLKDFTTVEKMALDHRNMVSYIYNTIDDYDKEITNKYIFRSPYFVDAFKYRLLEGIEFETSHRSEWEMYGIDNEENRIKLEEDVDYFNLYRKAPIAYTMKELEEIGCVNENMYIFCKTYVFSERMRELNIVTIEFHNDRLVDALGLPVFKNVKGLCEKNYAEIGDLLKN